MSLRVDGRRGGAIAEAFRAAVEAAPKPAAYVTAVMTEAMLTIPEPTIFENRYLAIDVTDGDGETYGAAYVGGVEACAHVARFVAERGKAYGWTVRLDIFNPFTESIDDLARRILADRGRAP